ncbi:MAG TPA: DNA repair protein RecO [Halanaerobiaceae bacterium]|jgi:DNA repair protein RecO (recombination protein O)|nr:DNA repair protein RecO [Bacillota bacterium]HHU91983.1 DNA repair protein RecO [Halanaerobiaceae bacterium]HOA40839.1 DNA repair protein RecO [Halanaerobiales bacterium]HPZ62948.1 DNA repair protein RecO [Halanaerobiales bacterium]HQD04147.1 DNA repair protein RecO [Halanaerobiales bacterium]
MAILRTEAIVLKQFDLGEADKIITFFTKDYGKIRAVAKGVRKSKSSISGIVLPFNYNLITIYRGKSIDRINQIRNIFTFNKVREDLIKMAYASFVAEAVEKVSQENQANEALFALLLSTLHKIMVEEEKLPYIELVFKISLLVVLGLKPQLDYCVSCNKKLAYAEKNYFHVQQGGLICPECYQDNQEDFRFQGYILSVQMVESLKKIINNGFKGLRDWEGTEREYRQLDQLSDAFIKYHLELKIKSYDFLHMIKKLGET